MSCAERVWDNGDCIDCGQPEVPGTDRCKTHTSRSWIRFRVVLFKGKTERWEVTTVAGIVIGRIEWSTGWRRYVLRPGYPTVWEEDCLREIAIFLEEKTRAYKERRA